MKPPTPATPAQRQAAQLLARAAPLHQAGRLDEAALLYRQVLSLDPGNAMANHLLGVVLLQSGNAAGAVDLIGRAIASHPGEPQFHFNLGTALLKLGRAGGGIDALRRAAVLKPADARILSQLSAALAVAGRHGEAAAEAALAVKADPRDLDARFAVARAHYAAGNVNKGRDANRAALAVAHEVLPRLDQLAAATRRAIALDPGFAEAYRTLSMMVRRAGYDDEMAAMQRLYADPATAPEQRMQLAFALGRGFDDIGRYDEAFAAFVEGNALKQATLGPSATNNVDALTAMQQLFTDLPALPERTVTASPIFVVGLPRSGKTSIEAILQRHPDVTAGGEMELLGELAEEFYRKHRLNESGASLSAVPAPAYAALGAEYLRQSRARFPAAKLIVDTMPANFRHIGLLRLALPGARVVHSVRDPLELLISLFQKFFPSAAYDYTYDPAALLAYRRAYAGLMQHWKARFPGFVLDADLETISADPERKIRELLEFCGLGWDSACLVLANSERRLGEPAGLPALRSPAARLAPYSAIFPPPL